MTGQATGAATLNGNRYIRRATHHSHQKTRTLINALTHTYMYTHTRAHASTNEEGNEKQMIQKPSVGGDKLEEARDRKPEFVPIAIRAGA